ncbi:MAG: FtsX-like permease family protein [Sphingobacteriaceae bacterium]|nr:MAG: FtsX-like permease family protein [Sphingobacteriaceae bacterium]
MIKSYLKVAWRNLWRNKSFSAINILGLALGMTFSLLIFLWIRSELSVDTYHRNGLRLYQVYEREYYDHKVTGDYDTPAPLAEELKKVLPEVEYAVTLEEDNRINTFKAGNKLLKMEGTAAKADLFKMFSFPLLQGSPQSALNSPANIAISRKMAGLFFGSPEAAMGKTIRYKNQRDFTVSAVFENLPKNTSRKFDYLINWEAFAQDHPWTKLWMARGPLTYIMLRAGADPILAEKKITHFLDSYIKEQSASYKIELGLQKFSEGYLHAGFSNGNISGGKIEYVHLFSLVAVFILLIACINFMNLTTARSVKRAKEIGVRKAVGAMKSVLIRQFIGEAILLAAISMMVAILLVILLLPVFNQVTQKQIQVPFLESAFWLKLMVFTVIIGIVSGSYPALYLSSFNPVTVLKGTAKLSTGSIWFRKGLVVFQFVLSVLLIIGTMVVSKQVDFLEHRNLGYDRENLIDIPFEGALASKYDIFKMEASKVPGVGAVTHADNDPTDNDNNTTGVAWTGKDPGLTVQFAQTGVGYEFVSTMKLKLQQGRDFSKNFGTDSTAYLINETAARTMGYTEAIGKPLIVNGQKGHIVGVLRDFHFESLHQQIQPIFIRLTSGGSHILVRTRPSQTKQALIGLERLCKELNPDFPFTYQFLDEKYQRLYTSEQVVGKLSNVFALMAIFISYLGLLGLAMFTAEQRLKEISIRKVLGASAGSIFTLLSAEFLVLVVIAFMIASPLSWYGMNKWLDGFAYRTNVEWWMFALSALIVLTITLLTVSFQAVKAAFANPVKSLKAE